MLKKIAALLLVPVLLAGCSAAGFLVDPARRNRWCFSGSLLARKRELNLA